MSGERRQHSPCDGVFRFEVRPYLWAGDVFFAELPSLELILAAVAYVREFGFKPFELRYDLRGRDHLARLFPRPADVWLPGPPHPCGGFKCTQSGEFDCDFMIRPEHRELAGCGVVLAVVCEDLKKKERREAGVAQFTMKPGSVPFEAGGTMKLDDGDEGGEIKP